MAITVIGATFIKVTAYKHNDAGESVLVSGINMNSGIAVAEVYAIDKSGMKRLIGSANTGGKDDSVAAIAYSDGMVRMFVSEADIAGSGTTSAVRLYDFPNMVGKSVIAVSSGGNDITARAVLKAFLTALRDAASKAIALI